MTPVLALRGDRANPSLLRGYLSASGSRVGQVLEMFKKKESKPKVRVLFVEQKNDFASQMAEYFAAK